MRIYFAAPQSHQFFSQLERANAKNILISYAYFKSITDFTREARDWWPESIILDSGAFTVWTKDKTINIDRYLEFCDVFKEFKPETTNQYIVNLDVLPGRFGLRPTKQEAEESARQGFENMKYIDEKGFNCIPVFHQHEDFKWLEKLTEVKNYIGISPANDVSMKEKLQWLDRVFSFLKDKIVKDKLKTHGFAVTGYQQLLRYPFYSADSSSWVSGGKWGVLLSFKEGKFLKTHYRDNLSKLWSNVKHKDMNLFTSYQDRNYECILAYQEMEKFITNLWETRDIKWSL